MSSLRPVVTALTFLAAAASVDAQQVTPDQNRATAIPPHRTGGQSSVLGGRRRRRSVLRTTPVPRRVASGRPTMRAALAAGVRRPARARDRRDGRCPERPRSFGPARARRSIRSNVSIGNGVWKSTDGGETLDAHGTRGNRPGRSRSSSPHEPGHRLWRPSGTRSARAGTRRLSDAGRRHDVGTRAVRGRNTGRLRDGHGPRQPRKIIATHVGSRPQDVEREQRGARERHPRIDGRRGHLEELEGNGLPTGTLGKDRGLHVARATRTACTRSSRRATACPWRATKPTTASCGVRRTAATPGSSSRTDHDLATRQAYYTRCGVSSGRPRRGLLPLVELLGEPNGGETHRRSTSSATSRSPGWDHHDMWIDPTNGDRFDRSRSTAA